MTVLARAVLTGDRTVYLSVMSLNKFHQCCLLKSVEMLSNRSHLSTQTVQQMDAHGCHLVRTVITSYTEQKTWPKPTLLELQKSCVEDTVNFSCCI